MPTKTKQFCSGSTEAGFSLIEMMIVVAIFLLVAAIGIPILSSTLNRLKLRGAAQQLSELYQEARMRAVQDDTYYEVLLSPDSKQAYVDLSGNGTASVLTLQLPATVSFNNAGAPAGLDQQALGFAPLTTETSSMFDQDGVSRPGLAWSSRGFPCQRGSATSVCQTGKGWLQYLQRDGNPASYAAVSVSPAGRVRVWSYDGGVWR
jgi:prepilin-type N-terminal cleavage/methylation domain-containing protein